MGGAGGLVVCVAGAGGGLVMMLALGRMMGRARGVRTLCSTALPLALRKAQGKKLCGWVSGRANEWVGAWWWAWCARWACALRLTAIMLSPARRITTLPTKLPLLLDPPSSSQSREAKPAPSPEPWHFKAGMSTCAIGMAIAPSGREEKSLPSGAAMGEATELPNYEPPTFFCNAAQQKPSFAQYLGISRLPRLPVPLEWRLRHRSEWPSLCRPGLRKPRRPSSTSKTPPPKKSETSAARSTFCPLPWHFETVTPPRGIGVAIAASQGVAESLPPGTAKG